MGVDGRLEWVQNACLNALDGSEDGLIGRDLLPLWLQLGMPNIREQLREEISSEVQAGRLHSFWQCEDLLDPYDGHPGVLEGMEDAETCLHGDDDDDDDDDADNNADNGDGDTDVEGRREHRDMEELPDRRSEDREAEARAPEDQEARPTGYVVSCGPAPSRR